MKNISIIDSLTLTHEGKIYGHFANTANQYKEILGQDYRVTVVGGETYSSYFDDYYKLPFITTKGDFQSDNKWIIFKTKVKSAVNVIVSLFNKSDYYVFQDGNRNIVAIILFIFSFLKRKVVFIRYTPCSKFEYKMIKILPNKICYVITSLEETKKSYPVDSIIVPDYFPTKEIKNEKNILYDFVVLGTIVEGKDYEDVVKTISRTKYKLLIAGFFSDKNRLKKLNNIKSDNIIIIDKYLDQKEYDTYLNSSRYVVLPYKKELYTNKSSGVTLEALYAGKPVIAVNNKGYEWIEKYKVGILYNFSMSEIIEKFEDERLFNSMQENILQFIETMKSKKECLKSIFN